MCVCVCVRQRECVCVCVCVREKDTRWHRRLMNKSVQIIMIHFHFYLSVYKFIYLLVYSAFPYLVLHNFLLLNIFQLEEALLLDPETWPKWHVQ